MVGNGVTNYDYDTTPALVEIAYAHSLYDTTTYNMLKELKCDFQGMDDTNWPAGCADWYNDWYYGDF